MATETTETTTTIETTRVALPQDLEEFLGAFEQEIGGISLVSIDSIRAAGSRAHPGLYYLSEFCQGTMEDPDLAPEFKIEILNEMLRRLVPFIDDSKYDALLLPNLTLYMGSVVEMGSDPEIAYPAVLNLLKSYLPKATKVDAAMNRRNYDYNSSMSVPYEILEELLQSEDDVTIEDIKSWRLMELVVLPLMAMISRSKRMRQELRRDGDFKKALYGFMDLAGEQRSSANSTYYIRKVLETEDDVEVVVLHPEMNAGCIVEVEAIQNCFQFFSLLQEALSDLEWGQKTSLPRAMIQKVVEIARSQSDGSSVNYYDHNQWNYSHWTGFHDMSQKNLVSGYLKPSQLLSFSLGAGRPETRVILLNNLASPSFSKWNANLFNPIHSALSVDVRILRFLTKEEVNEYLVAIKQRTYLPVPPEAKSPSKQAVQENNHADNPTKSNQLTTFLPIQQNELMVKQFVVIGLKLMVEIIKQHFPDRNPTYEPEHNWVNTDFNEIRIRMKIHSLNDFHDKMMVAQCWEAIPSLKWTGDGLQVVLIGINQIPDEALRQGANEWFEGTFKCLLDAVYFNAPSPYAAMATTNTADPLKTVRSWEAYRGTLQIQDISNLLQDTTSASAEKESSIREQLQAKQSEFTQILVQIVADFLGERDLLEDLEDLELIWIKMYLGKLSGGEFNGEIVVNNMHLSRGQDILVNSFGDVLNDMQYIAFRQFFVVKALLAHSRR